MLIRRARPEDALAVETIRIDGWQTAYRGLIPGGFLDALEVTPDRLEVWSERFRSSDTDTRVAEVGAQVIGMATAGPSREEDGAGARELYALYVSPGAWRGGAGTALMAACEPVDVLWVLAGNAPARAFYERHGFRPDGSTKDFDAQGTPVPEIRMRRLLG